jgi:hypothetical protein
MEGDVLAVLKRGNVEVTFLTVPSASIDDRDYAVVLWEENSLTVGVSNEYMDGTVDDDIAAEIATMMYQSDPDEVDTYMVREFAVKMLAAHLEEVLNIVLDEDSDSSDELNLAATLERILDEG